MCTTLANLTKTKAEGKPLRWLVIRTAARMEPSKNENAEQGENIMCTGNIITIVIFGIFEALLGGCLFAGWLCDGGTDDSPVPDSTDN
jgi:hypothetical protein